MKSNKAYTVSYRMTEYSKENYICVLASNKVEAYEKATFEELPKLLGYSPYSTWVSSVTYNNGNYKRFNTCEGLPY